MPPGWPASWPSSAMASGSPWMRVVMSSPVERCAKGPSRVRREGENRKGVDVCEALAGKGC